MEGPSKGRAVVEVIYEFSVVRLPAVYQFLSVFVTNEENIGYSPASKPAVGLQRFVKKVSTHP
jgi:hypothetical protein